MARVIEEGEELILQLSPLEKLGSLHNSIRVPKSSLIAVRDISNSWLRADGLRGFRAPGTGIPWVIMLGTLRRKRGKDFAVVYGRGSAKVYEFSGGAFRRWIVTNS
jgi:hypothetical protein